ncbi:hypothetical protein BaRGS_00010411, partial [Batillaria attramentaria]
GKGKPTARQNTAATTEPGRREIGSKAARCRLQELPGYLHVPFNTRSTPEETLFLRFMLAVQPSRHEPLCSVTDPWPVGHCSRRGGGTGCAVLHTNKAIGHTESAGSLIATVVKGVDRKSLYVWYVSSCLCALISVFTSVSFRLCLHISLRLHFCASMSVSSPVCLHVYVFACRHVSVCLYASVSSRLCLHVCVFNICVYASVSSPLCLHLCGFNICVYASLSSPLCLHVFAPVCALIFTPVPPCLLE